jgi:enamine deaminase RidA (YjgF/YER057c/UK114 family)
MAATGRVEKRLAELGLELPQPPQPVGNYLPAARVGDLVFTSGQTARIDGVRRYVGVVGQEVSQADAYLSARDAMLNCLACVKQAVGSLDRVKRVVKVVGFVNVGRDFGQHPAVIDGASDLLERLFGAAGRHARSAVGLSSLPSNVSVEVELVVEVGQRPASRAR